MAAIRKINAASGARKKNQTSWLSMIALIPIDPAKIVGISNIVNMGISNETITATWRNAPMRANLLFDDQPAMIMESVPIAPAAMIYSAPMFKSTPSMVGARGTTAHRINTDIIESIGAMLYTTLSAPPGVVSSLMISLMMSANGWIKPNGPTRLGPMRSWKRETTLRSTQTRKISSSISTLMRSSTPRKPIKIFAAISGIPQPVKISSNQSAVTLRGSFQKLILLLLPPLLLGHVPFRVEGWGEV